MSLVPSAVAGGSELPDSYYFALKDDPGLVQTLSLSSNTISISGGNSINIADATTVSTSAVKLTAQSYIPGFLTTNFNGRVQADGVIQSVDFLGGSAVLNAGLSEVTIGTGVVPAKVRFQKSASPDGIISYDGNYIRQTSTSISTIQMAGVVLDSFGSPGAAGQQLQSSGPGLPVVWGAGSGVGLTAVVAGSNIGVDNTNPIAPVVNVEIKSDLNMNLSTITNCADITVKGATPGINFKDSTGADQGDLTYIELTDKLRLQSGNILINTNNAPSDYLIEMGNVIGALDITTLNKPIRLIRNDATNTTVQSRLDLNASSVDIQVVETRMSVEPAGKVTISEGAGSNATLRLENNGGKFGEIIASETGGFFAVQANSGYSLTMESTDGNVNIATGLPDTLVTASVNGFSAGLSIIDTAGVGSITAQVSAGQYNFGNMLSYNGADTMLVDPNRADQVPTNQISVAQFFPRDTILPVNNIDNTNPPLAKFKQTNPFTWRYSGTGVGSSYCRADRVEVIFDICILGSLNDIIQWGIKLVDAATEYPSVGAFSSYDTVTPATGLEYATVGHKTNPSNDFNHTASIRCYFDGVNAIADGNSVYFNIFAISRTGTHTVTDGWYSFRIRPITRIP